VSRRWRPSAPLIRAGVGLGAALVLMVGSEGCGRYGPPARRAAEAKTPPPATGQESEQDEREKGSRGSSWRPEEARPELAEPVGSEATRS